MMPPSRQTARLYYPAGFRVFGVFRGLFQHPLSFGLSIGDEWVGRRVPSPPALRRGAESAPYHKSKFRGRLVLPVFLAWFATSCLHAHPIHTSLAEADYNGKTQQLEVALRVFIDDFETVLSVRAKHRVSLEKTPVPEFDALAHAYLAETFTVRAPDGRPAGAYHWVGRELKDAANELWYYFEVPLPGGIEGARLRHGALFEQFSNQINSVRVQDADGRKVTLVFLPKQKEKTVKFHP